MAGLLARINQTFSRSRAVAVRDDEARYSVDQWMSDYQQSFNYNGTQYVMGGNSYSRIAFNDAVAEIANSLPGYAAALRAAPPAFAAEMVRALILSQARFTFRNTAQSKSPKRTFGTRALSPLEQPGGNVTTGEMLARMEWHAGLAGNAYVYRQAGRRPGDPPRLRVLRPDWVAILWGSDTEPEDAPFAVDNQLLGYVYWNGGYGRNKPVSILPDSMAHWAPLPDPENAGLGMSWVTPALRDMQSDVASTEHKLRFFSNGAVPGLVIKGIAGTNGQPLTRDQFNEVVDSMELRHTGVGNSYKTLYLTAGADATVIGANMKEIDFTAVQGRSETRVSFLSRVPASLLGISEGLAGSSLNAGNFGMARRIFADSWVYPSLQSLAGALSAIVDVPSDAELWFDVSDMPILREDSKDQAEITQIQAAAIASLINSGYTPKSCVIAIQTGDLSQLEHTGLFSVQLQPPGNGQVPGAGGVPVGPDGTVPTGPAAGAGAPPVDPALVETVPPEDAGARAAARTRRDIARAKRELAERDAAAAALAATRTADGPVARSPGLTGREWLDVARALTRTSPVTSVPVTSAATTATAPETVERASDVVESAPEATDAARIETGPAETAAAASDALSGQEWTDAVRAVTDTDAAAAEQPDGQTAPVTTEVCYSEPAKGEPATADAASGRDPVGEARRAVHDEAVQAYRTQSARYDELRVHSEALRILGGQAATDVRLDGGADLDDGEDEDLDDASLALLTALNELSGDAPTEGDADGERAKAFNAAAHPRNPKGAAGGGRFRSLVDRIKDAVEAHGKTDGKGDPFEGFDREQLRRVAKARGISLDRGESQESISKKLLDHLGASKSEAKPTAATHKPKAVEPDKPKPKPKPKAAKPKPTEPAGFDVKGAARQMEALDAAPDRSRVLFEAKLSPAKRRELHVKLESLGDGQAHKMGGRGSRTTLGADEQLSAADAGRISAAVADYMDKGYFGINGALHEAGGGPLGDDVPAEIRDQVDAIDRMLDMSRIDRDSILFRGTRFVGDPPDELDSPGYSSATADDRIARAFSLGEFLGVETGSTSLPGTPTVMEIRTPKGTPGVQLSDYKTAAEILLPRGLKLRKVEDQGMRDGVRHVVYEVVPAGDGPVPATAGHSSKTVKPGSARDLLSTPEGRAELDRRVAETAGDYAGKSADSRLAAIGAMQGYDAPPTVASEAEMDRLLATGDYIEAWRGMRAKPKQSKTAAEVLEDFRSGPSYYGEGIFGNGYYFTVDRDAAHGYSDGTQGSVLRVLIPKSATTSPHGDIRAETERLAGDDDDALFYDEGRYAAARGIDGIVVDAEDATDRRLTFNWLNRSALIVQEA